ncbi:DNA polymerase III subunit chi [Halieaceae bacterium IMCC14734]|uniref:DNA polymerase III subunit chi n=1 Tax=Candidatus Litorirhabdus singularis TaxID=2518993 RepID=A0ABT3TI00_9GAMM|nr:DNA polymerase III subunit chi [Candidatus Litorirhabdus singularis]MCX2981918.1 DNA polymerase III subunit chi [Candidatus Litorirhabdus singularis]
MTEVDFYILSEDSSDARQSFACRLTDKAFKQGRRVYIHTADEASAKHLDQLLWDFRPQSFLPHCLASSTADEPIVIGCSDSPGNHSDVLINLALQVPDFVGRFERVTEVVTQAPEIREPLRQSARYYKDRGYPVKFNKL